MLYFISYTCLEQGREYPLKYSINPNAKILGIRRQAWTLILKTLRGIWETFNRRLIANTLKDYP